MSPPQFSSRRNFMRIFSLAGGYFITSNHLTKISEPNYKDWQNIRNLFSLKKDKIYFNNGTYGPNPDLVLETLNSSLNKINATGEYGHTNDTITDLSTFLNVSENELALTHNTTEGINIAAFAIPLKEKDEVILTDQEHAGNAIPWLKIKKEKNINIKVFTPKQTQEENIEAIKSLITKKTKVIAIPHVTCTNGITFPIKAISSLARQNNIYTCIDGAHTLGTLNLDLKELDVDFYAMCGHKWLCGPGGTGVLYVNNRVLSQSEPVFVGAYSTGEWVMSTQNQDYQTYNPTAHRFYYGTQNKALYDGMSAAIKFHTSIGKQRIQDRVKALNQYLYDQLSTLSSKIDILTPKDPESRLCMVTFRPKNKDYNELGEVLSQRKIRVRRVPESNLNAIRISTHIYNFEEEIDKLVEVMDEFL